MKSSRGGVTSAFRACTLCSSNFSSWIATASGRSKELISPTSLLTAHSWLDARSGKWVHWCFGELMSRVELDAGARVHCF